MTTLKIAVFVLAIARLSPVGAAVLPYGAEMEVRLLHKVASSTSHVGDVVEAALITPVFDKTRLLIPAGAVVSGTVTRIDRLGFGLRHGVARLDLHFTQLHLADGSDVAIDANVFSVETAREAVRSDGTIVGINPTANFSTGVTAMFTLFLLGEPEFRLPILGFKFLAARSPNPEISFSAGTEMVLRMTRNVELPSLPAHDFDVPLLSASQIADVQTILSAVPAQQTNRGDNHPSDLVNILLLGNEDEIKRAFSAAGWTAPESHGVMALYHMFHCAVERKSNNKLPMSNLKLNGYSPDAAFEKNLDTFSKRHHIRLWRDAQSGAWLGAATEDVSYKMYKGHVTHGTDKRIDNERAKIVNDLAFTGCIDKGALIPRDSLKPVQEPGSAISTDGDIAVLQMNGCDTPHVTPGDAPTRRPVRVIQIAAAVVVDIARSNPFSLGYSMARSLVDAPKQRVNERIQATRSFDRPSAVASASAANGNGALAVR